MRRSISSCISVIAGVAIALVGLGGGLLAIVTPPGPERIVWWRVVSITCIGIGLFGFYVRNRTPDWTPEWGRRVIPVYASLLIIVGVGIFLLSLLSS